MAISIREDPLLGVEVLLGLLCRQRAAVRIARQHHPDFQEPLVDHPGQGSQPVVHEFVFRRGEPGEQPSAHHRRQVRPRDDRLDIRRLEFSPDQQPHATAVPDQPGDASCRDGQR